MEPLKFSYRFKFADGTDQSFELLFDRETMEVIPDAQAAPPEWTRLETNKCEHCPLNSGQTPHCPVARNIAKVVEHFKQHKSFQAATIAVTTDVRTYMKRTDLQEGLFGILGLTMSTSGCPHMNFLKPMARLHVPFSTVNETITRTLSVHLLKQYFVFKKGGTPDLDCALLDEAYQKVNQVNQGIIARIRSATKGDAGMNAMVILDGFASLLSMERSSNFSEVERNLTFRDTF